MNKKKTFKTIKMYIQNYFTCIYNISLLLNFINFSCYIFKTNKFTTHIQKEFMKIYFLFMLDFIFKYDNHFLNMASF